MEKIKMVDFITCEKCLKLLSLYKKEACADFAKARKRLMRCRDCYAIKNK